MSSDAPDVQLSAIDEERFGIRTARASSVTIESLPSTIAFCHQNGVALLIARSPASELRLAQEMEKRQFILTDTLVYYTRNLTRTPIPPDSGTVPVRPFRHGEESQVKTVATDCFRGYSGHYHADERLDRDKCDEAYVSWALRSCLSRDVADQVLVAEADGAVLAFATLRRNSAEEGEGVLFGVAPSGQGRGIYRSLMIHGMEWCREAGAERMAVSTQITNVAVQRVWTRLGFEPSNAYYTFHRWFDDP